MDISELTENQKSLLKQFRHSLADCILPDSSDAFLLSWLIARDFDLNRAKKMLQNSLEWRQKNRVDFIREEFKSPEVILKYFPFTHIGRDKKGRPLWLFRTGRGDFRGILCSIKKEDFMKHIITMNETSVILAKEYQKMGLAKQNSLAQATFIYDMEGFSLHQVTHKPNVDMTIEVIQNFEANYPELLHRTFIINASRVLSIGYALVKPFLHERTANKISIYHDTEEWKQAILAEVDADQLPFCYGGSMLDSDGNPNCTSKCNMGGLVPKEYFMSNKGSSELVPISSNDTKKCLNLASGSKEQLQFNIEKPNSILRWEFSSKNGDIGFSIFYKNEDEITHVFPYRRVDSHISTVKGDFFCNNLGSYIVEFDNCYSFLRSKKINFSIIVEQMI